jgi:MFS family permease
MRVANGKERDEHAAIDNEMALTLTRCSELACESIPGSIVQTGKFMQSIKSKDGWSKMALASIVVSALTTGFTSATISFDFDVSPQRRRDEPTFYGYIPDSAGRRTTIFFCMIMNGALLLLVRSVSTALLAMAGWRWIVGYLVGDMGLYERRERSEVSRTARALPSPLANPTLLHLLTALPARYFAYKLLRRDFLHWVPMDGVAGVIESVLVRFLVKVLVDYTGVIQFRGSGEMGGVGWTGAMVRRGRGERIFSSS